MRRQSLLLATLLVACTSATANRARSAADRDILAAPEIEVSNVGTLHEAIVLLRPHFLFTRGRTSMRCYVSLAELQRGQGVRCSAGVTLVKGICAVRLSSSTRAALSLSNRHMQRPLSGTKVVRR